MYKRLALDGMRWGKAKIGAIRASMTEGEDFMSYVFPLLRYHDRLDQLTAEDFKYWFSDGEPVSFKGYVMHTGVDPATFTPKEPYEPKLPESSMEWLSRIADLCEEKGIALVLIKSPSIYPEWHAEWDAEIAAFAKSRGLRYDNTIAENDAVGIDMQTDTYDQGQHLNVYGAEKLARWIGAMLKEEYGLSDHRGEMAYDADYAALTARYENEKQRQEQTEGN